MSVAKLQPMRAYAPASTGNVSLGFDVLGAALKPIDGTPLGDELDLYPAEQFELKVAGRFAHALPADPSENIVTQCYQRFIQQLPEPVPGVSVVLHKHLPIGSGLGSSAASVVVALQGFNAFYGEPYDQESLLRLMGELEGQISGSVHYDNVAPSYLGGLTLMTGNESQIALRLPAPEHWYWVVCYSGIKVSTAEARAILPQQQPLANTLVFGQQLAVFVDALHRQDSKMAASVMKDVIAEPHRKALLPRFDDAKAYALENGALSFGISGSGPTVFAVCEDLDSAQQLADWLQQNYVQNEFGFSHVCRLDNEGAVAKALD